MDKQFFIRELRSGETPPYELLLLADPSRAAIDEYLARGICYVADDGEEIIGVYVLLRTRLHTMEIVNIAVAEPMQGKGIGKKLVLDAIAKARSYHVKKIEIGTGNSSLNQLALYQKCGFRITWIDRDFFIKHYPEKIMENGIQCKDMIRLEIE